MERQNILMCLSWLVVASTVAQVDPRGNREMVHGTKADQCATQKEWPFCVDDDWGPKCPSGCRVQGLMDTYDQELLRKIENIRKLLADNQASHRSADHVSKQTYDHLREKLTLDAGNDNTYYDLAQSLHQRIVDMKIRIDRQLTTLRAQKERVKDQVVQMQRLEVDIDMKLRACKGSCQSYNEYSVDKDSYVALERQVDQLDQSVEAAQSVETVSAMYVMKSRALKEVVVDSRYRSRQTAGTGDAGQTQDFFPDVKIVQLSLEGEEGDRLSPPTSTVSKVPGVSPSGVPGPSGGSLTTTTLSGGGRGGGVLPQGSEAFGGGPPVIAVGGGSNDRPSRGSITTLTGFSDGGGRPVIIINDREDDIFGGGFEKPAVIFHRGQPSSSSSSSSSSSPLRVDPHSGGSVATPGGRGDSNIFGGLGGGFEAFHRGQPSSSSSSSSSSSFSSPSGVDRPSGSGGKGGSITTTTVRGDGDFGGGGGGFEALAAGGGQPSSSSSTHVSTSTKSVSCTRSVRKTVVHTRDGPVEKTETVMEGGPECHAAASTEPSKGGSSSSSSSSSPFDTKTFGGGDLFGGRDPFGGRDLGDFWNLN